MRLAGQQALGICLSLPPSLALQDHVITSGFHTSTMDQIPSSCLSDQHFTDWAMTPDSRFTIFKVLQARSWIPEMTTMLPRPRPILEPCWAVLHLPPLSCDYASIFSCYSSVWSWVIFKKGSLFWLNFWRLGCQRGWDKASFFSWWKRERQVWQRWIVNGGFTYFFVKILFILCVWMF